MHFVEKACYSVQKLGNSIYEYEDAVYVTNSTVAISDGATESSFSKEWANTLVTQICDHYKPTIDNEWIELCAQEFFKKIDVSALSWNSEAKFLSQGSFATLTALHVEDNIIRCIAFGDSCVFFAEENELRLPFPYRSSQQFSSTPNILGSICTYNKEILSNTTYLDVYAEEFKDLTIFLSTDALSHWILHQIEDGFNPFPELYELSKTEFENKIDSLRSNGSIRNDDTTLIILKVYDGYNDLIK